ncbi:unnamed protein product [Closterium sp. NIES-54]
MFITLYFIVTRLPDSLRSVRDHFLSLDPTSLTVDLLEQHLLAAETSAVAVGAARGTPRPAFFEGCSPSPLAPSYASAAAQDISVAEEVGAASASAKRRNSKGKGGKGGGGGSGSGGGGSRSSGGGSSGGGGGSWTGGGSGGSGGGGGGNSGSGGSGGGGTGGGGTCAWRVGSGGGQRPQQQRRSKTQSPQQLRIAAAALGASESGTLPGTTPAQALHTFTLDSGASRCFFRDSTTLTPLPAPVPVRLADPSGGPVIIRSSTVLPCPAVPSGSLSGLHLPSFSTNLVSTAALQDAIVTTTTPRDSSVAPPPGSPLPATPSWHVLSSSCLWSLPPLPSSPAPPCLPCVEGRQRAAPHSSSFPPTIAPLQTLHMDVWGPAHVTRQSRERYFLLIVDDCTRYTTVLPLHSKGEFVDVLIPWIHTVRLQLHERFGRDLPVLCLHSDRGGEFSSNLLREFFRGEGIVQSFTLPDSPQQNGIAERHIGLVMEVARTSMIHAAAPHFLWSFAVRYAAHQLNLWPRVSLPETSPTLRWTGEVGDASVFQVWGSRAFVCDRSADKLSARAIPCVFLGFVPDALGWQFYHPTLSRVLPTQDVTFDESVPFYRLFPYRSAPPPPPPLFLAPGPPPLDPLPPQGPAPSNVSQVDPLSAGGSGSEGAGSRGAEPGGEEPRGAEPEGVEPGGAESDGAESGGAEPRGAGAVGAGGAGVTAGASGAGGTAASGPGGACTRGAGAAGTGGVGGAGAGDSTEPGAARAGGSCAGAGAVDPGSGGAGGTVRPRPYFVPLLQQPPLHPASPLPAPSPYTEQSGGLTERREHASRPVSSVRTARRTPHLRPPPVPGTHAMTLRPSSVSLRVPLLAPSESSLPEVPDPESDRTRAASCRHASSLTAAPAAVGGG